MIFLLFPFEYFYFDTLVIAIVFSLVDKSAVLLLTRRSLVQIPPGAPYVFFLFFILLFN